MRRRIAIFFAVAALAYLALVMPWHGLGGLYAACFRGAGHVLFGEFGQGSVRLVPLDPPQGAMDTTMVFTNRARPSRGQWQTSIRFNGYVPTALVAALVLATPVPWRRRLGALAVALVLVSLFVALRLWLKIVVAFSSPTVLQQYDLPEPLLVCLLRVNEVLGVSLTGSFVAPVLIWALCTLRPGDWSAPGPA